MKCRTGEGVECNLYKRATVQATRGVIWLVHAACQQLPGARLHKRRKGEQGEWCAGVSAPSTRSGSPERTEDPVAEVIGKVRRHWLASHYQVNCKFRYAAHRALRARRSKLPQRQPVSRMTFSSSLGCSTTGRTGSLSPSKTRVFWCLVRRVTGITRSPIYSRFQRHTFIGLRVHSWDLQMEGSASARLRLLRTPRTRNKTQHRVLHCGHERRPLASAAADAGQERSWPVVLLACVRRLRQWTPNHCSWVQFG